jgi:hypothetical protein
MTKLEITSRLTELVQEMDTIEDSLRAMKSEAMVLISDLQESEE